MGKTHQYNLTIVWTGNKGTGTSAYRDYDRAHAIMIDGKPELPGSSDAAFRGDKTKHTPEDLFVAAIASCHMLWFLHLCSEAGIVVTGYADNASGVMMETANGSGYFAAVNLYPAVTVSDASMIEKANTLHEEANKYCFIANSLNFPVKHFPVCTTG